MKLIDLAAFIYVRYDSSRLYGKVLKTIESKTLIQILIENVRKINVDKIYILTSDREIDNIIVQHIESNDINIFRGDYENLFKRTFDCIKENKIKNFIRLNGDTPFIHTNLINKSINIFRNENVNFISNILNKTFPYGVSVEILNSNFYCQTSKYVKRNNQEHVTAHIYENIKKIRNYVSLESKEDMTCDRVTIDCESDFKNFISLVNNPFNSITKKLNDSISCFNFKKIN